MHEWFDLHLNLSMRLHYLANRGVYLPHQLSVHDRHVARVLRDRVSALRDALFDLYVDVKEPRFSGLVEPNSPLAVTTRRLYEWAERIVARLEKSLASSPGEARLGELCVGGSQSGVVPSEFHDGLARCASDMRAYSAADGGDHCAMVLTHARIDELGASAFRLDMALRSV